MMAGGSQRGCVGETHPGDLIDKLLAWLALPTHACRAFLSQIKPTKKAFLKFPLQLPLSGISCTRSHSSRDHLGTAVPHCCAMPGEMQRGQWAPRRVEEVPEPPETSETPLWSPGLTGKWQLLTCPEQQWPSPVYCLPTRYCNSPVTACNSFKVAAQRESLIKQPPSSMILHCNSVFFKEREKADISSAPQRNP